MSEERPYVCGHTSRERERLDVQALIYADVTRRALVDGGVGPGMRVVDLGCGTGSVSLLAAELVGSTGSVTGIDRDPEALEAARSRARSLGVTNVAYVQADVAGITGPGSDRGASGAGTLPAGSFDALVGRFVLMHQRDPTAALAEAARLVRPGGSIVMVESVMAALLESRSSEPPCPLYDRVVRWTCAAVEAGGADLHAGLRLRATFAGAGLPSPVTRLEAPVEGGADSLLYRYCAESVRSMLPLAERLGVTGLTVAEVDTLENDLRTVAVAGGHTLVAWPVVAAWCRVEDPA
ncbi:MAG: class I SAM-dependent methyltransferase [Gemmatimonadetes bacterium]|nr:class I SAM-dependent methyltransferase [Gemmatimonadota bacterium]